MPQTKFQDYTFSVMMVIAMVYCMTAYNTALTSGPSWSSLVDAFWRMWPEAILAFPVQRFLAGPVSRKLTSRVLLPGAHRPILTTIAVGCLTVAIMAPVMTLPINILNNGFARNLLFIWLSRLAFSFPFALCLQLFCIGPLVRHIFRTLFRKQLTQQAG